MTAQGAPPVSRAEPAVAAPGPGRPAYRDANVLRWLAAYGLSVFGDSVYFLALGWAAQELVGPAQVGLVMAVGAIPRAILLLGGGVVADRYGPRRVVIGSDIARCALVVALAAAIILGSPGIWVLCLVALCFGAVDALFMPAVGALPVRITTPDQLARVQGLRMLVLRIGHTVGPPVGGLAMGLGGASATFLVAGLLFALSLVLLLTLRIAPLPAPEPDSPADPSGTAAGDGRTSAWAELTSGLRYIRRHPLLWPLALCVTVFDLALVGVLNVGMVLLAAERGWGAAGTGWLIAGFSGGAALGASLIAVRGYLPRAGLLVGIGTPPVAVATAITGVAQELPVAVAAAAVVGFCGGWAGAIMFGLVQSATEPHYLGRVTSALTLGSLGLGPLAYVPVGAAIAAWGVEAVFIVCGALSLVKPAIALTSSAVRHAELPRPAKPG